MNFDIKTLELDLILAKVKENAFSNIAKEELGRLLPSIEFNYVNKSLKELKEFDQMNTFFPFNVFAYDYDITFLIEAINKMQSITTEDLFNIKRFFRLEKSVYLYMKNFNNLDKNFPHLNVLYEKLIIHQKFLNNLDDIVDDQGFILDDASISLKLIRQDIKIRIDHIDHKLKELIVKYRPHLIHSNVTIRKGRYCLAVNESSKYLIKGSVIDESSTSKTSFIEPLEIRVFQKELENLRTNEENEINRIIFAYLQTLQPELNNLKQNIYVFKSLDVLLAKLRYCRSINAVLPKLNKDGFIRLIDAKHPLIDQNIVVPINLTVSKEKHTYLITGPNTGGKTVALKTVGLLCMMVACGLFIPVNENSDIAVFNGILADIGDNQSILNSLSTFSSHITNIKRICDNVKGNMLILLDEIGSGTDPDEGSALGIAIIKYLLKHQVRLLVTTHYERVKEFGYNNKNVTLASVKFDYETLAPLYELDIDNISGSHAILIAEKLGLKKEVIEEAGKLSLKKEGSNEVEIHYNNLRKEYELKLEETNNILSKQQKLLNEYQDKVERLENQAKSIKDTIKKQYESSYKEKINNLDTIIKELKEKNLITTPEYAALKSFESLSLDDRDTYIKIPSKKIIQEDLNDFADYKYKIGDEVFIKSYQKAATIKKINFKKEEYTLSFDAFEMKFKKDDFFLITTNIKDKIIKLNPKKEVRNAEAISLNANGFNPVCDLRGLRFEEVKDIVEKHLDTALLRSFETVSFIHGFGTFAVKKALYEVLKKHPNISSYSTGGQNDGLGGQTIVKLK